MKVMEDNSAAKAKPSAPGTLSAKQRKTFAIVLAAFKKAVRNKTDQGVMEVVKSTGYPYSYWNSVQSKVKVVDPELYAEYENVRHEFANIWQVRGSTYNEPQVEKEEISPPKACRVGAIKSVLDALNGLDETDIVKILRVVGDFYDVRVIAMVKE